MALDITTITLLQRLKDQGEISSSGAVIELGAQQLSNSFLRARAEIETLGKSFGVTKSLDLPPPIATGVVHGAMEHLPPDAPSSRPFWEWLGYRYAAIDIDGTPGSIPLDLNFDKVPRKYRGKFDLVTNFGTTEHAANQINAFEIIHDLAAHRAHMIHLVPAQGWINHGLVNYNPKFFWMLARSNGYALTYMNYFSMPDTYGLPKNVLDNVLPFEPDVQSREAQHRMQDGLLVVILKKAFDIAFVPPLDIPTGTPTDNKALRKRYWTVFKKDAFENL